MRPSRLLKKSISSEKPFNYSNEIKGQFFKTCLVQQSASLRISESKGAAVTAWIGKDGQNRELAKAEWIIGKQFVRHPC